MLEVGREVMTGKGQIREHKARMFWLKFWTMFKN